MTSKNSSLTQDFLKEILFYNPRTGAFSWLCSKAFRIRPGDIAGTFKHGYVRITIDGEKYPAYRLAWLWFYGEWPEDQIDHINRVRYDNRISNLRDVSNATNSKNRNISIRNTSGSTGVYWRKDAKKWRSNIIINGIHMP